MNLVPRLQDKSPALRQSTTRNERQAAPNHSRQAMRLTEVSISHTGGIDTPNLIDKRISAPPCMLGYYLSFIGQN